MRNKLLYILVIVLLFTGCTLADKNLGGNSLDDTLAGVVILTAETEESVAERLYKNGVITGEVTLDGETIGADMDIDGEYYLAAYLLKTIGGTGYYSYYTNGGFSGNDVSVKQNNGSNMTTYSTSFIMTGDDTSRNYYIHLLYQRSDGSLYISAYEQLFTADMYSLKDGGSVTITYTKEGNNSDNEVNLEFVYKDIPEEIVFYEYDKEGNLINKKSYKPGNVPEEYNTENNCEFVTVQSITNNGSTYQICNKENNYAGTLYPVNENILGTLSTMINFK